MCNDSGRINSVYKCIAKIITLGGLFLWLTLDAGAQTTETFVARLAVMPVEASTIPNIAGSGTGSAVFEQGRLVIDGAFIGLHGPVTIARLHEGVGMGIRGAVLSDLLVSGGIEGKFSGEVELSDSQIESLRQGKLYIQIYSEAAPEGNLWGWLLQ